MMNPVKTKSALRNQIYKVVNPLTKGFFSDDAWQNVQAVWAALEQAGVRVTITKAEYREQQCKTWSIELEAFGMTLSGHLVASFCGTVQDPTSRYDLCFIV